MSDQTAPFSLQLALQGGGAKLVALVAVMEVIETLEKEGIINITRIAGTSAGAIVGALYTARVPMAVVKAHLNQLNLDRLLPEVTQTKMLWRFLRGRPLWSTDPIREELLALFRTTPCSCVGDLAKPPGIPIYITATDLKNSTLKVSDDSDAIVHALLDSSALPIVFRAIRSGDSNIVDGGICENLPSDLLEPHIATDGPILGVSFKLQPPHVPTSPLDFCKALLDTAINNSMTRAKKNLGPSVFNIDTDIGTFDFRRAFSEGLKAEYNNVFLKATAFVRKFAEEGQTHNLPEPGTEALLGYGLGSPKRAATKAASFISSPAFAQGATLLRQAVCEHQEPFIEYMFLASEKHKVLKEHFHSKRLQRLLGTPRYVRELRSLFLDVVRHLNTKLKRAFETTCKYLQRYYALTNRNPRICLKTYYEGKIYDTFRDRGDYHAPFPIEGNTGFEHIRTHGTSYLCPDIPMRAKGGLYNNTRLIMHRVHRFEPRDVSPAANRCEDPDWELCWQGIGGARPCPESCYKSTLIIPAAVRKSQLSGEFDRLFKQDTTVGYLCFDHRCTNYFSQEDEDIGFIFADILSLYLINRLIYTSNSETFRDVQDTLNIMWHPSATIHAASPTQT